MSNWRATLAVLLVTVAVVGSAVGQQPVGPGYGGAEAVELNDLPKYKEKGRLAHADGQWAAAEKFFRQYYEAARQQQAPSLLVDAAEYLVRSLLPQTKLTEAAAVLEITPRYLAACPAYVAASREGTHGRLVLQFWRARVMLLRGEAAKALVLFQDVAKTMEADYRRSQARLGVGECYLALGQWANAENAYQDALRMAAPEERDEVIRGLCRALFQQGRFKDTVSQVDNYWPQLKEPTRTDVGVLKVAALLAANEPRRAFAFFRDELRESSDYRAYPDHYVVIRKLGLALAQAGEYQTAISTFRHLLVQVPEETQRQEALLDLAEAAAAGKMTDVAVSELTRFLQLYKTDQRADEVRIRIGALDEEQGKYAEALGCYAEVFGNLRAWPGRRYKAAMAMGLIWRRVKKAPDKAIAYFREAEALDVESDNQARAAMFTGETCFEMGEYREAAAVFQRVAEKYAATTEARAARFKQGLAHIKSGSRPEAAVALTEFLKQWPDDPEFGERAWFYAAESEHLAGDHANAVDAARSFLTKYPRSDLAPRVLIVASEAAAAVDRQLEAIGFLTTIIEDDSPQRKTEDFAFALYRRGQLRLANGQYKEALADANTFLEKFATDYPEWASDLCLRVGDYYASNGDYEVARKHFLLAVEQNPGGKEASTALYEAAKNAFYLARQKDDDQVWLDQALAELAQLEAKFPAAPKSVRAQTLVLRGDILTIKSQFEAAATAFGAAADLVEKTSLAYAALGREGDCLVALATPLKDEQRTVKLEKAATLFQTIIAESAVHRSEAFVEMARYRLGKVYELLGKPQLAEHEYREIVYNYRIQPGRLNPNWRYFARAGFRLAEFCLEQQPPRYGDAIGVYKLLANDKAMPFAEEADRKRRDLEKLYAQ